jgi:hypothetical protein
MIEKPASFAGGILATIKRHLIGADPPQGGAERGE